MVGVIPHSAKSIDLVANSVLFDLWPRNPEQPTHIYSCTYMKVILTILWAELLALTNTLIADVSKLRKAAQETDPALRTYGEQMAAKVFWSTPLLTYIRSCFP